MSRQGQPIDHLVVAVRDLAAAAARYEALGFTVTPRASHPDEMGTANRLVQFAGHNFIELLEVDRPERLVGHDLKAVPPRFSFGAFNRDYLKAGAGLSMLVLAGRDSAADVARFAHAGLQTYAPFDFGRRAILPDGSEVEVAFSLAFATDPAMQRAACFTCHNRFPENFWKPAFQDHANGVERIAGRLHARRTAGAPRRLPGGLHRRHGGTAGGRPAGLLRTARAAGSDAGRHRGAVAPGRSGRGRPAAGRLRRRGTQHRAPCDPAGGGLRRLHRMAPRGTEDSGNRITRP